MSFNNFLNANEVYPILDLIRRELRKRGYAGAMWEENDGTGGLFARENEVASIEVIRDEPRFPALVTKALLTYTNGMIEQIALERDESIAVVAFTVDVILENSVRHIRGEIIREQGLFKKLQLIYPEQQGV